MTHGSGASLRSSILTTRERLRAGREKIRLQQDAGLPGVQVSASLTNLVDGIILDLWQEALSKASSYDLEGKVFLVAHGGYGRRDLAPYSDVDLMLVPSRDVGKQIEPLVRQLNQDIVDAGLVLGFTVRTQRQACQWSWKDPTVFSSLAESRLLGGSMRLYQRYFNAFRQGTSRHQRRLFKSVEHARDEEREKWGETNYLLRPNVKRSRGGLRDIQLIRWIGFAGFGETDLEQLVKIGELPEDDYRRIRAALSFLLRLRNELHFAHGKNQDVLDRPIQMDIAQRWGYREDEGLLPVERLMGDYFEHTRNVRYAVSNFLSSVRHSPLMIRTVNRLFSRSLDQDIRMGPYHIWVKPRALPTFAKDLSSVLRLMDLSNRHDRRIAHATWQEIRQAMQQRPLETPDQETVNRFLSLLGRPGRLIVLLRRLHELRVLEKIIPAMERARGLLQFNDYHKYTVDAHSIRAVAAAAQLDDQPGTIGNIYRRIKDKRLLHLTLLIHDLGKGLQEDHSIAGMKIARETGRLLGLDKGSTELIAKLVKLHLVMNHTAFRHDLNDPEVVSGFAATVGTQRVLDLLLVHSVADLTAVGPDVLTDWKARLLEDLYSRTSKFFRTGILPGTMDPETNEKRREIDQVLVRLSAPPLSRQVLSELPFSVLERETVEEMAEHLCHVGNLEQRETESICWHRYLPEQEATEYTLVRRQGTRSIGTFARTAGAFTAAGLVIQRAEIESLPSNIVWDAFVAMDPDFTGTPPESRTQAVCNAICEAVDDEAPYEPAFRRVWNSSADSADDVVEILPNRVLFDNATFERYTVVSLFTYDRAGLLYSVAQCLASADVVLHFAKISTHLDQVVDVFYLTELDGSQLISEDRQAEIRNSLLHTVSDWANDDVPKDRTVE